MGAANVPARRLVAVRSALRYAGRTEPPSRGASRPHHPSRAQSGFPEVSLSELVRRTLRCATRTAGRNAGGFSGRHPGTAAGPRPGYPDKGFRRRGRRSPPATTGAGTETPPLGRKGRAEDKGGGASGDKRRGYARCGGGYGFARPRCTLHVVPGAARSGATLIRDRRIVETTYASR